MSHHTASSSFSRPIGLLSKAVRILEVDGFDVESFFQLIIDDRQARHMFIEEWRTPREFKLPNEVEYARLLDLQNLLSDNRHQQLVNNDWNQLHLFLDLILDPDERRCISFRLGLHDGVRRNVGALGAILHMSPEEAGRWFLYIVNKIRSHVDLLKKDLSWEAETPIEQIGLTTPVCDALHTANINTVGNLMKIRISQLERVDGHGPAMLHQIQHALDERGLMPPERRLNPPDQPL